MADRDYLVTARKYRPSLFKELVAQEHVTDTLKNALRLDRVAHAYLFSGPRGVGKTTAARILAKAINCETPREDREDGAEPCCECESCRTFEEGGSLNVFELDAASNRKVADVEPLLEKVTIPPQGGRKKVYIIDEVHMFSKTAFNALLKTLEEPPDHALFIFATTEPNKVIPTVRSRCQRFDFRRIPVPEVVDHLREICAAEGIEADEESLMLLARKGNGALRDALSAFDQAISLCGTTLEYGELTQALGVVDQDLYFDLTEHVATQHTAGVLKLVRHVVRSGYDLQEFLVGLAEHLRNLLVARSLGGEALAEVAESTRTQYAEAAQRFGEADLLRLLTIAGDAQDEVKNSPQPRLKLETTLLKMAQMRRAADLQTVLQKVDRLEQMAEEGEIPASLAAAPDDRAGDPPADDADPAPSPDGADRSSATARRPEAPEGGAETADTASTDASPSTTVDASAGRPTGTEAESPPAASREEEEAAAPSGRDVEEEEATEDEATKPEREERETKDDPDRGGEDNDDGPDDAAGAYNDLFGPPALDSDPAPSDEDGTPENDPKEGPTDATDRRTGPASSEGPTAQATVAEPEVRSSTGAVGVAQDWSQFVAAIRGDHIRLGLFLEEAEPVEVTDGVLIVSVARALHRDTLRDHRRVLLDHLTDTIDERLDGIEFVVDDPTPDAEEDSETAPSPASPREQLRALRDTYPALDVLFAEFEAEPIW